jgi:hypothetical protein
VRWLVRIVAVILVALWVPVTAHCELENISGLKLLDCCAHGSAAPHQDDDCAADGCAEVESGLYKMEEPAVLVDFPLLLALYCVPWIGDDRLPSALTGAVETDAPPELRQTWQFSCRAAPLVRAPSFPA